MKRTARIITTVAAMALTIAIMCVGIFAATKVTVASSGSTISFTATNDVSATVTATKQMGTDTAESLTIPDNGENKGVFTPSLNQGAEYTSNVTLGDIAFTNTETTFKLSITVTNTYAVDGLSVDAKYTVTCANADGYLTIATTSQASDAATASAFTSGSTVTVAYGKSVTFVTEISIANDKKDEVLQKGITGEAFGFSLELTKTDATPTV